MATRYRQRRLMLLVILLAVTVLPIIAVGAWWMWPLLIIPAVLAAPLAGGAGLVGTLLATAIALAAASAGDVSASEITAGFVAIIVVAALGAVHAGMVEGVAFGWGHGADADGDLARAPGGLAPIDVFHLVADRDCRRAEEAGAPVALALVTTPRLDAIITDHGRATATAFLDAAGHGVARVIAPSDLVVDMGDGRFMALVAGDAALAREAAERIAVAIEAVHVRGAGGARITSGAVAIGTAQWADGDQGIDGMVSRAESSLELDARVAPLPQDDDITGEFRSVAVADAARRGPPRRPGRRRPRCRAGRDRLTPRARRAPLPR